jgi:hypothetical protein
LYEPGTPVVTFKTGDISNNHRKLEEIQELLNPQDVRTESGIPYPEKQVLAVPASGVIELYRMKGTRAISYFSLKVIADDMEAALRGSILSIYFDHATVPQVQAPVGDFFGAAPGFNPFASFPFTVGTDSTMVCRFTMPFKKDLRIEIENTCNNGITLETGVRTTAYHWVDGESMHFRARWKISHPITAYNISDPGSNVSDIIYLMAMGKGRLVGTAAYLYNPSNVPTSWGNWWGEGDEKIYVDRDTFPSIFGTGSEDYFNYSWSSPQIFSYPYCGQPRNDGPGNRGYVSNFRWHILDDIPFKDKFAFYMELGHHGNVPNFSYGRMAYFYALPGTVDDYRRISRMDIQKITYLPWFPEGYCGSAGFRFIQAEQMISVSTNTRIEKENLCAEGRILLWTPAGSGDELKFQIPGDGTGESARIGFTLAHSPQGGLLSARLNGRPVKFDGKEEIELLDPDRMVLDNHLSEPVQLREGKNEFVFVSMDHEKGKKIGIDFVWIKEP